MYLEQLKYLIEIVNSKSINKAAQNLFLTQPALSISINQLEDELQYPLLKRTKKGVIPTEEGERIIREAQVILDMIQNWYLLKPDQEYKMEGVVHIQAIPSICVALSNTLVLKLQNEFPKLSVYLHEKAPQYMITSLENGAINIGITTAFRDKEAKFIRKAENSKMHVEKLEEDQRQVVISANNPLSEKAILSLDDLKSLTLAYYSDLTDDVSDSFRKYFNPERCYRLNSREAILQLVAEDGAVGIFPQKLIKDNYFFKNKIIKSVPMDIPNTEISYYMLYPDLNTLSLNELIMLDIIRENFPV